MAEYDLLPILGKPCRACGKHELKLYGKVYKLYCSECWDVRLQAIAEKTIRDNLKAQHSMTLEEYNMLLAAQENKCAICKQPETAKDRLGNLQRLSVDHDHKTGKIRGLLCRHCNYALGRLDDDIGRVRALLTYLESCLQ